MIIVGKPKWDCIDTDQYPVKKRVSCFCFEQRYCSLSHWRFRDNPFLYGVPTVLTSYVLIWLSGAYAQHSAGPAAIIQKYNNAC